MALLYVVFSCLIFVTFSCGILGQVWYLIVSIPEFCLLPYFVCVLFYFCFVLLRLRMTGNRIGSVVVDFLFIVTPIVGICGCSMFCCTLFYVHSSVAIILMGKKERAGCFA